MNNLWNTIILGIKQVIEQNKAKSTKIIGISTCAQRIGTVFLDQQGSVIYGGPNIDIRGIDSAYLIEDEFSEEELFNITGHSPSLLFSLARLLWFKEEEELLYQKIKHVLMLDDWLVYQLSGKYCTDLSSAAESQFLDIQKRKWSSDIIETFDLDPGLFPEIVDSGTIVGELKQSLSKKFDLAQDHVPIIKTGGDTQASLLGMGAIEEGNIGISLGTTAPLQLVTNKPIYDSEYNYWISFHSIKGKWLLEAHSGNTGTAYNWFKECFLNNISNNSDNLMETYLKNTDPGVFSTYAFLGPEHMNIKNQTSIKRGVFVFQPPIMVSEELPKIENFARSVIENIAFGLYENYKGLQKYADSITKTCCAGGMSKSNEFCKILASVLTTDLIIPIVNDSSFIGTAINVLMGLNYYRDYKTILNDLMNVNIVKKNPTLSDVYRNIYNQWKNLKNKVDDL
jgi:sugar (pentulose or hexulose) kinase